GSRPAVPDGAESDAGTPLISGLLGEVVPGQQLGAVGGAPPGGGDLPLLFDSASAAGAQPTFPAQGRGADSSGSSAPDGEGPAGPAVGGAGDGLFAADPAAPEPASLTLLTIGALALLSWGWRRRTEAE